MKKRQVTAFSPKRLAEMQLTICAGRHTDRVSTANEQHLTSALWITPTRDSSQSHGKNVAKSMKSKTLASTKE